MEETKAAHDKKSDEKLASVGGDTGESTCEGSDKQLENVIGGIDIADRLRSPNNDKPPIQAPILNPFG